MSNEHSELFRAMAEADGPGDFEYQYGDKWESTDAWHVLTYEIFDEARPWRLKPRTVEVSARGKTFHLPEPMREVPEINERYWFITAHGESYVERWRNSFLDRARLVVGRCNATEADAQAWADFERFARTGVE